MTETLALLVYPDLWYRSRALHPDPWQDQFRCLCGLARAFLRGSGSQVPAAVLSTGERMLLSSLASVDPEMMILHIVAAFPGDPNPMQRLDPGGPQGLAAVAPNGSWAADEG
jgi:hypothetical protein